MKKIRITGLEKVLMNLNKEINKIKGRTRIGIKSAAIQIKRRTMQLTPVDTSNLRGSAYYRTYDTPKGPGAEIGYTASYAVYVHEINANYTVGQWKFLETALRELKPRILEIIRSQAKV